MTWGFSFHTPPLINGISPDKKSISGKNYPYVAEVYATIRTGLDRNSMAYKLYELLQTEAGKNTNLESGYIPHQLIACRCFTDIEQRQLLLEGY